MILKEVRAQKGPTVTSPCGGPELAVVRGRAGRDRGCRDAGTRPARWDHGVCRSCRGIRNDGITPQMGGGFHSLF